MKADYNARVCGIKIYSHPIRVRDETATTIWSTGMEACICHNYNLYKCLLLLCPNYVSTVECVPVDKEIILPM